MTKINTALLKDFLNELYPVGKTEIFLDNEDHSNYMGFTWQRDAIGKAIVGIDSNDSDFNTIGATGGSKELQAHNHSQSITTAQGTSSASYLGQYVQSYTNAGAADWNKKTGDAGTGNSGNLQPYKVFAIWVRTA